MSGCVIVGVDVGGTFTDLFLLERRRAASAPQGALASRRRGAGFPQRPARARRASRRSARSCTARRSAPTRCSSGAARRSASSRRAAFATCWKCAGATAAAPGDCGAISSHRRPRHAPRGRRAHARRRQRCARRSTATECAPRQSDFMEKGAQSVAIIFINAYANAGERAPRAGRSARQCGRTNT